MDEYIKRSDALNASKIVYIEYIEIDGDGYEDGNADEIPVVLKRDIEAIPAADVVPVVHGRWDHIGKPETWEAWVCSVCNMANTEGPENYCPHCGAKMDLED